MTSININELPLVSTATNTDVLILNVNNTLTSAITFQDFSANLNVFTNPGKFPDGTAADPSITFTNNDNTGIYRPGLNTIGFTTGSTQRAVISANGNLGINSPSPIERLTVVGNARVDVSSGKSALIKKADNSTDVLFTTLGTYPLLMGVNNSEKMRIEDTGNVLIGTTTNPLDSKLFVEGSVQVQETVISNGGTLNNLKFEANNVEFLQFNAFGAAAFNQDYGTQGEVLVSTGTDSAPIWADVGVSPSFFDFRNLPNIDESP